MVAAAALHACAVVVVGGSDVVRCVVSRLSRRVGAGALGRAREDKGSERKTGSRVLERVERRVGGLGIFEEGEVGGKQEVELKD
jgi:hypothetical protein